MSTRDMSNESRYPALGFTLVELLVSMSIVGILLSLALTGIGTSREAARRMQCSNNLRQQSLALHSFHVTHNSLPLGNDRQGGREHSWLSAILSQLEQAGIAEQWNRKVAWNDPASNLAVANSVVPTFRCPTSQIDFPGDSDYAGVQGSILAEFNSFIAHGLNNGILISTSPQRISPVSLTEVFDGSSQTMFIAEVSDRVPDAGGMWADGSNVISQDNGGLNIDNNNEIFSFHPGGAQVAMADGAIRFLNASVSLEILGGLCSRDGRENLSTVFEH